MKTVPFFCFGARKTSRRVVLGGLVSSVTWAQSKRGGGGVVYEAAVDPDNGRGALQISDPQGNVQTPLGFVVACPQGCASDKADGGENPDKDIFLSPEWMKQIYFISDANYAADAASFYAKSVHDDAGVKGCGLVSAKVEVRQVTRNGPQDYSYSVFGTGYYAIVVSGTPNAKGKLVPDLVWISPTMWDKSSQKIKDVLTFVGKHLPVGSPCKWLP